MFYAVDTCDKATLSKSLCSISTLLGRRLSGRDAHVWYDTESGRGLGYSVLHAYEEPGGKKFTRFSRVASATRLNVLQPTKGETSSGLGSLI